MRSTDSSHPRLIQLSILLKNNNNKTHLLETVCNMKTCVSYLWQRARWSILFGRSAQEPASVICDKEHGDPFCSACPHRNLRQLSVTKSTVIHFVLHVLTGTCVSYLWQRARWSILFGMSAQEPASVTTNLRKSSESFFEKKKKVEWIGKVDLRNEEGSKGRENLWPLDSQQRAP